MVTDTHSRSTIGFSFGPQKYFSPENKLLARFFLPWNFWFKKKFDPEKKFGPKINLVPRRIGLIKQFGKKNNFGNPT